MGHKTDPKRVKRAAATLKKIAAAPSALTAIETVALSKAVKDAAVDAARTELTVGHHDVDFLVRVSGPLLVAPPGQGQVKDALPQPLLLALVLEQMPGPARVKAVEHALEKVAAWRESSDPPTVDADTLSAANSLVEVAVVKRMRPRSGNVTAPLTVELIERRACVPAA